MVNIQMAEYLLASPREKAQCLYPLRIDEQYRIYLKKDHLTEIILPPLSKALYLLFLNHPEGISLYDLCDYRQELLFYYSQIASKRRPQPNQMKENIVRLVDRKENSFNEKCSQIKRSIQQYVPSNMKDFYYIHGTRGGKKRIALAPHLVYWGAKY